MSYVEAGDLFLADWGSDVRVTAYGCTECGALVMSQDTHTRWHKVDIKLGSRVRATVLGMRWDGSGEVIATDPDHDSLPFQVRFDDGRIAWFGRDELEVSG